MKGCSVTVKGVVQGVFFRASTKKQADALSLKGFVKNQPDGSVYIEVEGDEGDLSEFLKWCHHGPPHARVDACEIKESAIKNFRDFEIRRY